MLYLDSSALVKLYVNELFSIEMQQLAQAADQLLCHVIGYVEVRAAFASAERGSRISRADYMRMVARFKRDWLGISQVGGGGPGAAGAGCRLCRGLWTARL